MALEGKLKDFGLEAIFQLINSETKTGTLHIVCKSGDAEGFVYFRGGKIFGAVSNFNRQPIGERLVNAGHISQEQLHHGLDVQRNASRRRKLGQILISEGLITKEILRTFVKEQIQNTVFDLMPWTDGEFHFFEDQLPGAEDMGLLLSARKILSKGSARLDEWERIGARVPSLNAVFESAPRAEKTAQAAGFSQGHLKVLKLCDGRAIVSEIAKALEISEFEAASNLFDLVETDLIKLVESGESGTGSSSDLSLDGAKVDAFDALDDLELAPEDVISDRAAFNEELVALTDAARRGRRGHSILPILSRAVLIERVHLDRDIDDEEFKRLQDFVKGR